jgi:hypothetical protein
MICFMADAILFYTRRPENDLPILIAQFGRENDSITSLTRFFGTDAQVKFLW